MSSLVKVIFSILGLIFMIMLSYFAYSFYAKNQLLNEDHSQLINLKEKYELLLQEKVKLERDILNIGQECEGKIANVNKVKETSEKNYNNQLDSLRAEHQKQIKDLISSDDCDKKNKDQEIKADLMCQIKLKDKENECLMREEKIHREKSDGLLPQLGKIFPPTPPTIPLPHKPDDIIKSPPHLFVSTKSTTLKKEACLENAKNTFKKHWFDTKSQADGIWGINDDGYKGYILCEKQTVIFSVVGEKSDKVTGYIKQLKKDF